MEINQEVLHKVKKEKSHLCQDRLSTDQTENASPLFREYIPLYTLDLGKREVERTLTGPEHVALTYFPFNTNICAA